MAADPKPLKRHKADPDEWKILRTLKLGPCRVCGGASYGLHRIEMCHLVGRDLGGDDVSDNLVPMGSTCHKLVEERNLVACELLRESLAPQELAYVLHKKGADFLDRYYPRRSAEDVQPTWGAEASV